MSTSLLHHKSVHVALSSLERSYRPSITRMSKSAKYQCGIPTNMFQSPEKTILFTSWLVSELCSMRTIGPVHYAPVHDESLRSPDTCCTTWRIPILWKIRTFQKTGKRGIHRISHTKITKQLKYWRKSHRSKFRIKNWKKKKKKPYSTEQNPSWEANSRWSSQEVRCPVHTIQLLVKNPRHE
jgi:hypothetical protein